MNSKTTIHSYPNQDLLVIELADRIAQLLKDGVIKQGQASLAVSGGSTPVPLFKRLSKVDLPWHKIFITLVDERWVDPTDPDSNEQLVKKHLLQNRAAAASFTGMKNIAATAHEGESECCTALDKIPRPFDVLILGLGHDGHTASLFPGAEQLNQATDLSSQKSCIAITPVTAPHERMSLRLPAILDSKQIFLHITGAEKKEVLDRAMIPGPPEELPIRYILFRKTEPQGGLLSIYWAQQKSKP